MVDFARWWRRRGPRGTPPDRWLVVDVEASGLDATRDRLLAIAAVALRVDWARKRLAVMPGDSFEALLRQEQPSARDNILLHGIGVRRQQAGLPREQALRDFTTFAGDSPLLAFHAGFDRTIIERHAGALLGTPPANPWLDIEHLCGVTHREVRARSLDEWMAHFGIQCAARHQAAADVLAECELLQRIWPKVAAECSDWRGLERLAGGHRWVGRA